MAARSKGGFTPPRRTPASGSKKEGQNCVGYDQESPIDAFVPHTSEYGAQAILASVQALHIPKKGD